MQVKKGQANDEWNLAVYKVKENLAANDSNFFMSCLIQQNVYDIEKTTSKQWPVTQKLPPSCELSECLGQ